MAYGYVPLDNKEPKESRERNLLLTIIRESIHDVASVRKEFKQKQKESARWLLDDEYEPFTLRWCCDYANIDYGALFIRLVEELPALKRIDEIME